jgi:hypothetical protein
MKNPSEKFPNTRKQILTYLWANNVYGVDILRQKHHTGVLVGGKVVRWFRCCYGDWCYSTWLNKPREYA